MQIEIWKPVKGFEDSYEVSNFGRVRKLPCYGCKRNIPKILSIKNAKGDYLRIILKTKDKSRSISVHRLVYETFVGEIPKGKGFHVHHKDGDKQNNRVENLEMLTAKEHHQESVKMKQFNCKGMNEYNWNRRQPIYQITLKGEIVGVFSHADDAMAKTGICARNINQVANRKIEKCGARRLTAGGYIWRYKDEIDHN